MKKFYPNPFSISLFSKFPFRWSFLLLLNFSAFFGISQAQNLHEVRISSATACVGDTVSLPVSVAGLQGAGAISLVIDYNPSALTFVGLNSFALSGSPIVNAINGEVRLS